MAAPAYSPRARQGVENHRIARSARDAGRSVMHFSPLTPHRSLAVVQQRRQASPRPSPDTGLYKDLSSEALSRSAFSLNESFALNASMGSSTGRRHQLQNGLRASQTAAAIAAAKGYVDGDTVQVAPSFDFKHATRANLMKIPPAQRAATITQTNQRQARDIARTRQAKAAQHVAPLGVPSDLELLRTSNQERELQSGAWQGVQSPLGSPGSMRRSNAPGTARARANNSAAALGFGLSEWRGDAEARDAYAWPQGTPVPPKPSGRRTYKPSGVPLRGSTTSRDAFAGLPETHSPIRVPPYKPRARIHTLGGHNAPMLGTTTARDSFVPMRAERSEAFRVPTSVPFQSPFMGMNEGARAYQAPPPEAIKGGRRQVVPTNMAGRSKGRVTLRELPFVSMGTSYSVGAGAEVEDDIASVDSRGYAY